MINRRYNKSVSRLSEEKNRLKKIKMFLLVLFFIAIFVGLFFVSRLESLQVSTVEVAGEKTISKDDIRNATFESISGRKFLIFPKTNIFLINESQVASVLSSEFPRIESARVNKNANGVLKIEIKEREAVASWCDSACYLLDSTGFIYSSVNNDLELFGKVVLRGGVEGDPLMKRFQNERIIKNYLDAVSLLDKNNIQVSTITVSSPDKAIFESDAGNIFVDPDSDDLLNAIENALLVIEDIKSKNPDAKFEYIDTRFGNKVFYK